MINVYYREQGRNEKPSNQGDKVVKRIVTIRWLLLVSTPMRNGESRLFVDVHDPCPNRVFSGCMAWGFALGASWKLAVAVAVPCFGRSECLLGTMSRNLTGFIIFFILQFVSTT